MIQKRLRKAVLLKANRFKDLWDPQVYMPKLVLKYRSKRTWGAISNTSQSKWPKELMRRWSYINPFKVMLSIMKIPTITSMRLTKTKSSKSLPTITQPLWRAIINKCSLLEIKRLRINKVWMNRGKIRDKETVLERVQCFPLLHRWARWVVQLATQILTTKSAKMNQISTKRTWSSCSKSAYICKSIWSISKRGEVEASSRTHVKRPPISRPIHQISLKTLTRGWSKPSKLVDFMAMTPCLTDETIIQLHLSLWVTRMSNHGPLD